MTPEKLLNDAQEAKAAGTRMTLLIPTAPTGFPRGELLSETARGKLRSYDPDKVIKWLEANGLIAS